MPDLWRTIPLSTESRQEPGTIRFQAGRSGDGRRTLRGRQVVSKGGLPPTSLCPELRALRRQRTRSGHFFFFFLFKEKLGKAATCLSRECKVAVAVQVTNIPEQKQ